MSLPHRTSPTRKPTWREQRARTRKPSSRGQREGGLVHAAARLRTLKDELAAELRAMKRLHELSTCLLAPGELAPMLEEILACMIALQDADFGSVQLYDRERRQLELVATRNFPPELLERYRTVSDGSTCCGRAMLRRERVIIPDMRADPELASSLEWVERAGMRAAQSTPIVGRDGQLLGMITTQFARVHRPSEHELRMTDLCARQAGQLIERMQVEAALRRSQAYRAAAERLSHTGTWVWSPRRRELYWSDEMYALFGCDMQAGPPAYEDAFARMHTEDGAPLRSGFEAAVQARRVFEAEWRIVRPDGSVRYMRGLAQPVFDAAGQLVEYLGTATDVTERKRSEQALAQAHDELAHLTRVMSMGELAASVAHEVNQPLAAIVTNGNACLRWLSRETPNLTEARQAVERVVRDGIRAGEVVGRIRAYVRKAAPHTSVLDLNDVIHQSLALAQGELMRRQIVVMPDLQAGPARVVGDRVQLQQVMMNLLINAAEALGGVYDRPRKLHVTSRNDGRDVTVATRDSGVGLDADVADHLFDPFFTTKADGMGLGLAICRRIVEAHGGRIWALRNDDHGATLCFSMPAAQPGPGR